MKIHYLFPVILAAAIFGAAFSFWDDAEDNSIITISGNIEVTDVTVSFEIPGRLVERFVSEGQFVTKDTPVAKLDTDQLYQKVSLAEAELDAQDAVLQELKSGTRPEEIAQGKAKLHEAEAEHQRIYTDFARQKQLFEEDVISQREFDLSKASLAVSKAKVDAAKENVSLLIKGARKERIAQAQAAVNKARRALELAQTEYSYAFLTAPISGYVLTDNAETGEYVRPGTPILTIGDLSQVWFRGYISEKDLSRVKLGQKVKITTDTYPDKVYEGHISFISNEAEFTPKNVQTEKERVKLVYRIKIDVPNPDFDLKPGMPADGIILLASSPDNHRA